MSSNWRDTLHPGLAQRYLHQRLSQVSRRDKLSLTTTTISWLILSLLASGWRKQAEGGQFCDPALFVIDNSAHATWSAGEGQIQGW